MRLIKNSNAFFRLDTANLPSPGAPFSPSPVSPPTVSGKTPSTMSYPHASTEHHGNTHPDVAHHVRELHTHSHVHLVHNPDAVKRETKSESLQAADPRHGRNTTFDEERGLFQRIFKIFKGR